MRRWMKVLAMLLALLTLASCGTADNTATKPTGEAGALSLDEIYAEQHDMGKLELASETGVLSLAPAAVFTMLTAEASGTAVEENTEAMIDYSNVQDGYVMVNYTAQTDKRLKARVQGPTGTTYTYNLTPGDWEVFPLSDGNGGYKVTVYRNAYDTKYAQVLSVDFAVELADEFGPFLRPNQYVDFTNAEQTIAEAERIMRHIPDPLDRVAAVYDYVVDTLSYDYDKAATVTSGYLPVLDDVLAQKKGICFDYAALMAGMLRSQGVPCKLVVGYAGSAYHAWISVWTEGEGWVDGVIYFNGTTWHRMDPTFASSGNRSTDIMDFIGNDSNYSTKYIY